MDIDIKALKQLVKEREMQWERVVLAIEEALFAAYNKNPGSSPNAKVKMDRVTGHVEVKITELDAEGKVLNTSSSTLAQDIILHLAKYHKIDGIDELFKIAKEQFYEKIAEMPDEMF